ncbi:MAG: hypothetical protein J3K34DRAFT_406925 [Monoraphidium minutum]|nr:MAG: hypothetical protein J3K34DRAFT_406925 [Monoraphidium minutum]
MGTNAKMRASVVLLCLIATSSRGVQASATAAAAAAAGPMLNPQLAGFLFKTAPPPRGPRKRASTARSTLCAAASTPPATSSAWPTGRRRPT